MIIINGTILSAESQNNLFVTSNNRELFNKFLCHSLWILMEISYCALPDKAFWYPLIYFMLYFNTFLLTENVLWTNSKAKNVQKDNTITKILYPSVKPD